MQISRKCACCHHRDILIVSARCNIWVKVITTLAATVIQFSVNYGLTSCKWLPPQSSAEMQSGGISTLTSHTWKTVQRDRCIMEFQCGLSSLWRAYTSYTKKWITTLHMCCPLGRKTLSKPHNDPHLLTVVPWYAPPHTPILVLYATKVAGVSAGESDAILK